MNAARATDDRAKQAEQYAIVQREMAKDADRIFLVHSIGGIAYAPKVHGIPAATFPGTTVPALAGNGIPTPFLGATWVTP